jgi:hypothetical protein
VNKKQKPQQCGEQEHQRDIAEDQGEKRGCQPLRVIRIWQGISKNAPPNKQKNQPGNAAPNTGIAGEVSSRKAARRAVAAPGGRWWQYDSMEHP